MLKYYLCLYLLLYVIQVFGQKSMIAKQGFEDSEDTWFIETISTAPCTQQGDTWNYHTELEDITPIEGDYFWGIQDLNGNCGSSGFEFIEMTPFNIAGYRNVTLSFAIQVKRFDHGDDIKYQLWFDGVPQPEVLIIDGEDNFSHQDWEFVQIDIPNSTSLIKLRISIKQNGSDIAGFDNFRLEGIPFYPCSDLMISEYLEGGSSTNYRNNYIELYNPSDINIDLNSYQLVKFTGSNIESSAKMNLAGFLPPKSSYLIEDSTEKLNIQSNMSSNNSVMDFNGDDKIALKKEENIIDIIGKIGDSVMFGKDITLRRKSHVRSPNNEFSLDEWDTYGFENITNLGTHASYCEGDLPEIQLYGNGKLIPDGSTLTSLTNHSYFGGWSILKDTIIERSYTIKNVGNKSLGIGEIILSGPDSQHFSTDLETNKSILPNDSIQFNVQYKPQFKGIHTCKLEIVNTDPSENPYSFIIQGEGTGYENQPLIISQYYEGKGNNKWIEITNTSDETSPINTYYLAIFRNEATFHPIGRKPSSKKLIPAIAAGQTVKFSATLNTTAPIYAIDGKEIKTTVCSFTGDDILVISTSDKESCWEDRIDLIGNSGNWGTDLSMIRKYGCDASQANTGFELSDWLIENIENIDQANPDSNLRIGIHHSGLTTWRDGNWSNGKPDAQRKAIIESDYSTDTHGIIEACALFISNNTNLKITADEYIEVLRNLTIEGTLEVNHEGSLLIVNDNANIENKGSLLIHKSTTKLNPYDYTYWSSPIKNALLETVFWNSPKASFHYFSTKNFEDLDKDGLDDDNNAWVRISGGMQVGRGYTSMAPNTTPFQNFQHVTFSGTVNNGYLEIPVYALPDTISDQHHWNLIGNPYPSTIDAELLLNHPINNELLSKTLYFWTHSTPAILDKSHNGRSYTSDDYAMYTIGTGGIKANPNGMEPTQYISSCQGFFVEALKAGNIVFNNKMRSKNGNDHFFKAKNENKSDNNKIWLNLTNKDGAFSQILIGFIKGASTCLDKNYDGPRMNSQNPVNFYSLSNKQPLAIQGLPKFTGNEKIELGLHSRIEEGTDLQISIDHFEGNFQNYQFILHDKLLDKNQNLILAPYSFTLKNSEKINTRFSLEFTKKMKENLESPEVKKQTKWQLIDEILIVETESKDIINRLEIFDLNGRKLRDLNVNARKAEIKWSGLPSRGIFILRLKLRNSETLITKMIP